MKSIQTTAPGKLYVAGEYAVVEPGYSAIITAIDLFFHLEIRETKNPHGSIYSKGFTETPVLWERTEGQVKLSEDSVELKYMVSAIRTVEAYLKQQDIELRTYDIIASSDLDSPTGRKLGLGSSGAVTVATVRGLLQYYEVEASDLLVYKLSVVSQIRLAVNSSFGDLAAITYTGWVRYTSFDQEVIFRELQQTSIKEVVEMDWPHLNIQRLDVADDVRYLVGWTGSPASSNNLVGDVQRKTRKGENNYPHFLKESKASVEALTEALQTNEVDQIKAAVQRNRQALLNMGLQTNVLIETPKLTELCEIAAQHGAAAKTSGAGGGDSGIAFVFDEEKKNALITAWENVGITHLPLSVYAKD